MPEGFRINTVWSRIENATVDSARGIAVSNVSDVMGRINGVSVAIRPWHRGGVLAGSALTVRCRPGDNLMLHKALTMTQPGDVIVVDAGGALDNAIMGELMLARATQAGATGVVIHGAIRDVTEISQQDTPVFASGICHRGPYKDGPGEIGFAISLGGMIVHPGDLIIGDDDGVLALPAASANEILTRAEAKHAAEVKQLQQTISGKYDSSWIDAALQEKGCEIIE